MYICHNCGYTDYGDNPKTHCAICGTNVTVPRFALCLFLSVIVFILSCFLSAFNDMLEILVGLSAVVFIIFLPLALIERQERNNEIQYGFCIPDYPSEIIYGNPRVPDFKSYDYVGGIKDDEGVKKILFEVQKDGLNYYHKRLRKPERVDYSDITGFEIYEQNRIKDSKVKSILYGALLGATFGLGAGVLGGLLGGLGSESRHVLELQIKEDGQIRKIYVTSAKDRLVDLVKAIEGMADEE